MPVAICLMENVKFCLLQVDVGTHTVLSIEQLSFQHLPFNAIMLLH